MSKISLKHSGGNVVSLNSPTSAPTSADVAFKLPNADGTSGQAIVTDASGNLSFASVAGGKILQVLSVFKDDVFSTSASSGNFADITGLSVAITPSATTSKILIHFQTSYSTDLNQRGSIRMLRDSTVINVHAAAGNTNAIFPSMSVGVNTESIPVAGVHLDSPSTTSATTYKLQISAEDSAGTIYVNRSFNANTGTLYYRGASNLVVMEVGA